MRCVIARFPFDLTHSGVLATMQGVKAEPVSGAYVIIGRRRYPAKQVGRLVTGQDPRDFATGEVVRAMTRLGFTCRTTEEPAPESDLSAVQQASRLLGQTTGH
ncbi:SCO5918 family protein [Streptomyces sp. NPDC057694]|uniref:SCO5918 family protein n=1 Tax=unclassified Streptomyces TaxID=2593676 RepID=UPI0036CC92F6